MTEARDSLTHSGGIPLCSPVTFTVLPEDKSEWRRVPNHNLRPAGAAAFEAESYHVGLLAHVTCAVLVIRLQEGQFKVSVVRQAAKTGLTDFCMQTGQTSRTINT